MSRSLLRRWLAPALVGALGATVAPAAAQEAATQEPDRFAREGYIAPPEEIREALLAPWHRNVELDELGPAARYFVVPTRERRMPPLAAFAKRHYNLGGLEVDVAANRARSLTLGAADGLRLISARDGRAVEVRLPEGAKVAGARWSPNGQALAFLALFDDATHIYVADPENGRTRRLTRTPLLATLVTGFEWSGDGRYIFAVLVPDGRGGEPAAPAVATTPEIWVTQGEENKLRTFPSLLETPHEFALLEHYTVGQLARIEVANGQVREIGKPAMIDRIDPAPTGEYVRVRTIRKPYSDIVPVRQFAWVEEIWDLDGNVLAEVASEPVRDGADDDDEEDDDGRRAVAWRPDGQGLSYLQREPRPAEADSAGAQGGDAERAERPRRKDRVMQWLPPFDSASVRVVFATEGRIREVRYAEDASLLFITERERQTERLYAVSPDSPDVRRTIYEWKTDDFYANPGEPMMKTGRLGEPVVRMSPDGGSIYLAGVRYHEDPLEQAPQPFIDRVALETGEKTRIFESAADRYEQVVAVLDDAARGIVLSRESRTEVPNYYYRDLATGRERRLTNNRDYTPDLTRARREVIEVTRADGVTFWARVTLPENFSPGRPLPAMFWHYPREYESEKEYDESHRRYNKNEFPSVGVRSMEMLVRRGWAVVEPDIPIIGPRERWNDLYVLHLRNSFAAVIDELDRRGYIDRSRLAVGGHSYGGFGTINAMIRTPFFKAGIAGSPNTNRTLTPAGFQREPRTLWEARETYIRMSPIFWFNEITGALLIYQGMEDQNVGTFPENSWRAFHALSALGKTAALYWYPYEAHGPRAEETLLDMWARWITWLDTHVLGEGTAAVTMKEGAARRASGSESSGAPAQTAGSGT
ncbi:MAG TPA: prolyl oligopeptidase family serine peptidase [Longimicrobiales bacterium]